MQEETGLAMQALQNYIMLSKFGGLNLDDISTMEYIDYTLLLACINAENNALQDKYNTTKNNPASYKNENKNEDKNTPKQYTQHFYTLNDFKLDTLEDSD